MQFLLLTFVLVDGVAYIYWTVFFWIFSLVTVRCARSLDSTLTIMI